MINSNDKIRQPSSGRTSFCPDSLEIKVRVTPPGKELAKVLIEEKGNTE
jgi:hypothetical protein